MSDLSRKRVLPGVLLILIGSVFLLENLDIIPYHITRHLFSWYGWLLIIGTAFLIARPNQPVGLILITIGLFFLIPNAFDISWNAHLYWPVILIVLGIFFLVRQQRGDADNWKPGKTEASTDVLNDTSVFGGGDVLVTSENFRGGKVTYVFGGSSINLSRAKLAPGEKVVIDVFIMFGGTSFIVPSDWNVRNEVTAIFGGFSDERKPSPDTAIDEKKELIIKGTVLFGGGDIKNFA